MPTTYTTSPYFDDFNESKQFYRILFRPGRAVQARELTQIQTLIQSQIERFGSGIYKEGSFVTPPKQTYDPNYNFVKLEDNLNSINADDVIDDLVGNIVIGQTSGVRALVINSTISTESGDPPTIFVKYLNSGTSGSSLTFLDGEVIINESLTISIQSLASSSTGIGTAFSVGNCTLFAKGNFLYVEEQTLIIEKYSSVTDRILGFLITESIVTSDDDESLLDPAIGTFNYFAPGGDRYKISVTLDERPFTSSPNDDPNFVEIIRIQDSEIITNVEDPRFSILGDTLARRTFDESGDYVVNPFSISLIEHLRTTNTIANPSLSRDGLYLASDGGDPNLFVSIINKGKAYVKGYEVENINTKFVNVEKARDFANVNNGSVATQISSYVNIDGVYSIPSFSDISTVEIYDRYTSTLGSPSGSRIGTAKARGLQYVSGNVTNNSAIFQLYLFDVTMDSGYTFERNAKQLFVNNSFTDFTSNIVPTLSALTGALTFINGSTTITGSGTRFLTELRVGDYVTVSNATTTQRFLINSIVDNLSFVSSNSPTSNILGATAFLNTSTINDSDKDSFIIEFPYSTIKTVDPNNNETTYTTKRQYSRTLSANSITLTAGTDETFAPFTNDNYNAIVTSGGRAGELVTLNTTIVSRGGSPTGATITFNFSSVGLTTETVQLYTTINKTNSAAIKKTKTLVTSANVDFISQSDAQSAILSLGKADVYRITSIKMSNVSFGSSFVDSGSSNITTRYTFDNGQKSTYYDISKLVLKSGQPKPSGPVRVTFDYFTHGSGDYFTADSYSGINYSEIPDVTINNKTYRLRDCLDFRPKINDAGTSFSGSGSSTTEFIDPEIDLITDYQYYLPRTDKLVVDKDSIVKVVKGISSLDPKEPKTPDDSLALYVIKQNPYVFSLNDDVNLLEVDNKRYTMRDIGRIEKRVKNLEYYTVLSLLERDAQQAQIQDELGFERFKNGFLVDSFTGHGIGDSVDNPDYSVSVNFTTKEASPPVSSKFFKLKEFATNNSSRSSNNYVLSGDLISLPYNEVVFIENKFSSKTENLNPFSVVKFNGQLVLDPPGDIWFDDTRSPDIIVDSKSDYQTLRDYSISKKDLKNVYGSINDIQQLRGGVILDSATALAQTDRTLEQLIGALSPSTSSLSLTGNEVVLNTTIIPKMRDVNIKFTVNGMRPNTRLYAFFENENVTNYCRPVPKANANIQVVLNEISNNSGNTIITTDSSGSAIGEFAYSSSILNINTGRKVFRLTNSPTNNRLVEDTFAESVFVSDGILREISNELIATRPSSPPETSDNGGYTAPAAVQISSRTWLEGLYENAFGRTIDSEGKAYWESEALKLGLNLNNNSSAVSQNGIAFMENIIYAGMVYNTSTGKDNSEELNSSGYLKYVYDSYNTPGNPENLIGPTKDTVARLIQDANNGRLAR